MPGESIQWSEAFTVSLSGKHRPDSMDTVAVPFASLARSLLRCCHQSCSTCKCSWDALAMPCDMPWICRFIYLSVNLQNDRTTIHHCICRSDFRVLWVCPHGFHMQKHGISGQKPTLLVGWRPLELRKFVWPCSAYLTNHLWAVKWIWIPYPPSLWDDPCMSDLAKTHSVSFYPSRASTTSTASTTLLTTHNKITYSSFTLVNC